MEEYDCVVVGAGFTGATLAERLANGSGARVLVIDQRNHIGGNAFDQPNQFGTLVHKYGPHIFHTNSSEVWSYLNRFTGFRMYFHHVRAFVEGRYVPIPFNLNAIDSLFPSALAQEITQSLLDNYGFGTKIPILKLKESQVKSLRFLADYVYKNVFLDYSLKQWGLSPDQLLPSVTSRVPVFVSRDDRYFQDRYQGMPTLGYANLFNNLLASNLIDVRLNTSYHSVKNSVRARRLIFTGAIDEYFEHQFGPLPYRSLSFVEESTAQWPLPSVGTINYPTNFDYTRVTEQTILTGQESVANISVFEFPRSYVLGENIPYYPVPTEANKLLAQKYFDCAEDIAGKVTFAGRLGDYSYYNMDQAVARALHLYSKLAPDLVVRQFHGS